MKTHYTKNSEYETGLEEISVLFNEKKIQDTKTQIESVKFMHSFNLRKLRNDFCLLHLRLTPPLGYIHPTRKVKCHNSYQYLLFFIDFFF